MNVKTNVSISVLTAFFAFGAASSCVEQENTSPYNARLREEVGTGVKFGVFSEMDSGGRVVIVDRYRLERTLKSLVFYRHDAALCGFDFRLIVYRAAMPSIEISLNTECKYFTLHFPDDSSELGRGEFFFLTGEFAGFINQLISEQKESHRYLYRFLLPVDSSHQEVFSRLKRDEHMEVIGDDAAGPKQNPFIRSSYSEDLSSHAGLSQSEVMGDHKLGQFKPDDRFTLLINDPRLRGRIEYCSFAYLKEAVSVKNDTKFVREIKIFLNGALSDKDQQGLKDLWERVNGKNSFEYTRPALISVEMIADKKLDKQDMDTLAKKYCVKEIQ